MSFHEPLNDGMLRNRPITMRPAHTVYKYHNNESLIQRSTFLIIHVRIINTVIQGRSLRQ